MGDAPTSEPVGILNAQLVSVVAGLLDIEEDVVRAHPDYTFIQLGGDSVRALQLTFGLDGHDLYLDLESVLDSDNSIQKLSNILDADQNTATDEIDSSVAPASHDQYEAFSLIPDNNLDRSRSDACEQIGCSKDDIEDLLPITSQQKLLWLGSLQSPGSYIAHWRFQIEEHADAERLRKAWLKVRDVTPALRTRFVLDSSNVLRQAILTAQASSSFWVQDIHKKTPCIIAENGKVLVACGIENSNVGRSFHLYAHHAVYDRWSMQLILDDVRRAYQETESLDTRPSFIPLLTPPSEDEHIDLVERWRNFVGDNYHTAVPELETVDSPTNEICSIERELSLPSNTASRAELITAAWSWVCSRHSSSNSISFGITMSGRDVPVHGASEMAFPTFRTLPVCMQVDPQDTIDESLRKAKKTLGNLRELQSLPFDDISTVNDISRQACRFKSVVVVQTERKRSAAKGGVLEWSDLVEFDLQQGNQVLLECTPYKTQLSVRMNYNPDYLSTEVARPLMSHFCAALEAFSQRQQQRCSDIELFDDADEDQIRRWTRPCEERRTTKMYSFIEEHAEHSPDSVAIWTSHSTTTYRELMASAKQIAHLLRNRGAKGHVGTCFERSTIAVKAQIGVSMAGCAFVPMDPNNPVGRLEQIIEDSEMSLLVCSASVATKFEDSTIPVVVLDDQDIEDCPDSRDDAPDSTDTAYIIYTSGSTGKPKGVVIQHEQASTSYSAQKRVFNIGPNTRTLQFSSLAFDMSHHEIYMTLSGGGTVCIPTDLERFELDDFLARAKCNYSMLTPSVAATLSDKSLSQISDISLCGEAISKGLCERVLRTGSQPWIVYGPTETTVVDLGHKASHATSRFNLGYSFGATAWIVDADDPNRLASVGVQGQLAFSGYTLAAGYYNDPEKTDAAFRKGLKWTRKFLEMVPNDRVYLTGDLARYNPDGTIQFFGRLGGYTKIAGNRVDLDEIRHVLMEQCELPHVSVLICQVQGQEKQRDMLLCFFADPKTRARESDDCILLDHTSDTKSRAVEARSRLETSLPSYMVPSAFIPVNKIPLMTSGKLDAGTLRALLEEFDVERLMTTYAVEVPESGRTASATADENLSEKQKSLADAWAAVLGVPSSSLGDNSHFVRLGGDSLRAMELAAKVRSSGRLLRVADIFKFPALRDMAQCQQEQEVKVQRKDIYTRAEYDELMRLAADHLGVAESEIEEIHPCSSLQAQIMVTSEQSQGSFIHREFFELSPGASQEELEAAVGALLEQNELLRTRFFLDATTGRFLQAVMKPVAESKIEVKNMSIEQYLQGPDSTLGLGSTMCRFVMLERREQLPVMVWEMHHAIYDGHSHILLLHRLHALIEARRASKDKKQLSDDEPPSATFRDFLYYLSTVDQDAARDFWSGYLDNTQRLSLNIFKPSPAGSLTNSRKSVAVDLSWKQSAYTIATYIRAAFTLLLSRYASTEDVNFAATVNGRDLPMDGIEGIAGPTFATIPVRLKLNSQEALGELLGRIQQDSAEAAAHQAFPIEKMRRLNPGCRDACHYDMHLLVQSQDLAKPHEALESLGYKIIENMPPMELGIPFNLVATKKDAGVHLEIIYQDTAIGPTEVDLMLDQMSALLQRLTTCDEDVLVRDLFELGPKNQATVMAIQNNPETRLPEASTIPELVLQQVKKHSTKEALYTSTASVSYQELYSHAMAISTQISTHLSKPQQSIVFCFEKSALAVIAQLGILLAGHAFVPIDPSWPDERRANILEQTKTPLLVTSAALAKKFETCNVQTLIVDEDPHVAATDVATTAKPSDVAYVLFTSGSTGAPKGVVVEHGSISRTLQAYAERLRFTTKTRALLFASFTFDASVMETWSVLAAGGTLCIASDEERISGLSDFIVESECDCVGLTPSAAGLLDPLQLRGLVKTLLFCGEKCRENDLRPWRDMETMLVNAYGPTEACVNAATNVDFRNTDLSDVGSSLGGGLWVVNPDNTNEVLPVGCTGELVISGPVLARGYLNMPDTTANRFVLPEWPRWTQMHDTRAYKTGDLAYIDANGRLLMLGRNDNQMKINGIRVEAEEIENVVHQDSIPVKAVVASTLIHEEHDDELVVFFVSINNTPDDDPPSSQPTILPLQKAHRDTISSMHDAATHHLPTPFLPSLYIPISQIPLTTAGKINRRHLIQSLSDLDPAQLNLFRPAPPPHTNGHGAAFQPILSPTETILSSMWSTVIHNLSLSTLTPETHFIEAGGDSMAAIRLAAVAKARGFRLPVGWVYGNLRLRDMAGVMVRKETKGEKGEEEEEEEEEEKEREEKENTRPGVVDRTVSSNSVVTSPGAFELIGDIQILSPEVGGGWTPGSFGGGMSTGSPEVGRGRRGDYFGRF